MQELLDRFPGGYWLYVENGSLCLMRYDEYGERVYDSEHIVETFTFNKIDGGAI